MGVTSYCQFKFPNSNKITQNLDIISTFRGKNLQNIVTRNFLNSPEVVFIFEGQFCPSAVMWLAFPFSCKSLVISYSLLNARIPLRNLLAIYFNSLERSRSPFYHSLQTSFSLSVDDLFRIYIDTILLWPFLNLVDLYVNFLSCIFRLIHLMTLQKSFKAILLLLKFFFPFFHWVISNNLCWSSAEVFFLTSSVVSSSQ